MGLNRRQLARLGEIFGDRLITDKHELVLHGVDVGTLPKQVGWLMNTKPDAIVQPESPEEIAELYRFANEESVPVVPRGAGTSGYGGAIPRKGGIVVDMRWMRRVLTVDREGLSLIHI